MSKDPVYEGDTLPIGPAFAKWLLYGDGPTYGLLGHLQPKPHHPDANTVETRQQRRYRLRTAKHCT